MSLTANSGEFRIASQSSSRAVIGHPRRYAAFFIPAASRSRREVRDSGAYCEVRLVDGAVEIRMDGPSWVPLHQEGAPWGVSYCENRRGDGLKRVALDMLAGSRGRLIAKEEGTDRIFHLVLSPLFRTYRLVADGLETWLDDDGGDAVVPSTYLKLDPGFFRADVDAHVPRELTFDYGHHPAADRFGIFAELARGEMSDGLCVVVQPGIWHVIDGRSPLKLFDLDDLRCIGDRHLREVATKPRIKAILNDALRATRDDFDERARQFIGDLVDLTPEPPIPAPLRGGLNDLRELVADAENEFGDLLDVIENIPGIGGSIRALRRAIEDVRDEIDEVSTAAANAVESAVEDLIAGSVRAIADGLADALTELAADRMREWIVRDGFAALFYPVLLALLAMERQLRDEGAVRVAPPEGDAGLAVSLAGRITQGVADGLSPGELLQMLAERARESNELSGCGQRSTLRVHLQKALRVLLVDNDNPALRRVIADVVEAASQRPIPNAPPDNLPSYEHVVYERVFPSTTRSPAIQLPRPRRHPRRSIAFSRVLDLGVGTIHWAEHWQRNYGGEMHSLLGTKSLFQQEQYSQLQYRFINGPLIDGDGWQDGTTNFYMLVELDDKPHAATRPGAPRTPASRRPQPRFGVLWHDEQTYFTQRWRLVHPTHDTAGDLFSLSRSLRDQPDEWAFHPDRFWSPFDAGNIRRHSRMAVVRQIIAVTGYERHTRAHEIYTLCFAHGICDHSWRWRAMPQAASYAQLRDAPAGDDEGLDPPTREVVYTNSLRLRDDGTLVLRGFEANGSGPLVEGRWVQRYLPADCRHLPERTQLEPNTKPAQGFVHPWEFLPEPTYQRMNRHFALGVYVPFVDSRCQYYEVDLLPDEDGNVPTVEELESTVWRNGGDGNAPLTIDTRSVNWDVPSDVDGYVNLSDLVTNRGELQTMSMYESTTRFRLVERRPKGIVALFCDKRDDDLQSASHLPRETVLVEELPEKSRDRGSQPRRVRVLFRRNQRVLKWPNVQEARIQLVPNENGSTRAVRVDFWTAQSVDEVNENLWRVHLAALGDEGQVLSLFEHEVFGTFERAAVPIAPLTTMHDAASVRTDAYRYTAQLDVVDADRDAFDRFCRPAGRRAHGTSIWFEDIVGHVSTPELIVFA